MPRVITIGGDIENNSQLQFELSRAVRIFNRPGVLKLFLHNKARKIPCRVNTFETGGRNGAAQPFVLQLICDNPYFEDFESVKMPVFRRVNMLKGVFKFPLVVTLRYTEAILVNTGDVKTEPVFYIQNISGGSGAVTDDGIEIINHTTGQSIKLLYSTAPGEEIIINVAERTVKGSVGGNLLNHLSPDTFLDSFWLEIGRNKVEVISHNEDEQINVVCEYISKYIEAVM